MSSSWLFLSGVILAAIISSLVVAYLQRPLLRILIDLCGTDDRAKFWIAFSNVTVFLTPILFALHHRPDDSSSSMFQLADQLEVALLGLVISVFVLGFVLSRFIPPATAGTQPKAAVMGQIQN
jgi:hypothetical protein